eukprot:525839-Pelagomonas_calceolata.AAC.6
MSALYLLASGFCLSAQALKHKKSTVEIEPKKCERSRAGQAWRQCSGCAHAQPFPCMLPASESKPLRAYYGQAKLELLGERLDEWSMGCLLLSITKLLMLVLSRLYVDIIEVRQSNRMFPHSSRL